MNWEINADPYSHTIILSIADEDGERLNLAFDVDQATNLIAQLLGGLRTCLESTTNTASSGTSSQETPPDPLYLD